MGFYYDHSVFTPLKPVRSEHLGLTENEYKCNRGSKDKDTVKQAWSYEGNIYVVYYQDGDDGRLYELQYKDYQYWLDIPWPARTSATAAPTSQSRWRLKMWTYINIERV